ncbi:uncharacterized protein LOC131024906 [Salvia miltiorrhiza]|uniref:uncharacterized protein LOC131024906 n=1 Tax=Salvia miltiorrhiza TaxID=226208 RepID=UPI0025AD114B|nr:uncharacterized protein LOC131024906 [Salvia miltiorrhiza]
MKMKKDIVQFHQFDGETFYEAWERFKEMIRKCPNHGLDQNTIICSFYTGCSGEMQRDMNASANGALLEKSHEEAAHIIENLAANSYQFPGERTILKKVAATTSSDPIALLTAQLTAMNSKIDAMSISRVEPVVEEQTSFEDVNYINNNNNRGYGNFRPQQQGGYQGQGQYNQGFQANRHPNLSYGNPNNFLQPPPGFAVSDGMIKEEKKLNLEEILMKFITATQAHMTRTDERLEAQATQLKMLEMKVGQIAESLSNQHQKGQFPSNTVVNPKEHCKAITIRSGKILEESKIPPEVKNNDENISSKMQGDKENEKDVYKAPPPYCPPIPFPQRLQKKNVESEFSKFLEIFRKVHINIPLVEALQQMPKYAKFLKEVLSKKKKLEEFETVNLTEECCAILQKKLPIKIKDPGSFTIPCDVGNGRFGKALCDLGASINLMPLSIFNKLEIGTIKPTTIALQMADRSVSYPKGIVEDVLVRVDKFIFLVDFVVLDMVEDKDVPLILGRPFLATGRALIDVAKGKLTLRVNDESVTFSIHKAPKHKDGEERMRVEECKLMQVIEPCINMKEKLKGERKEEEAQGLELKLLPTHLKYAFFGENEIHPMGQDRVLQLKELDEYHAFEKSSLYKERTTSANDEMMHKREFAPDDEVLLLTFRQSLPPEKPRSKWTGPFKINKVFNNGAIELRKKDERTFVVEKERIKAFLPLKPKVEVFVGTTPEP